MAFSVTNMHYDSTELKIIENTRFVCYILFKKKNGDFVFELNKRHENEMIKCIGFGNLYFHVLSYPLLSKDDLLRQF
jgi:hypothetical protein